MSNFAQKGKLTREAGWSEVVDGDGRTRHGSTQQCVHCGGHFFAKSSAGLVRAMVTPEQAKILQLQGESVRGWCYNCGGPICGPQCVECVPTERLLEGMEKLASLDPFVYVPTVARHGYQAALNRVLASMPVVVGTRTSGTGHWLN